MYEMSKTMWITPCLSVRDRQSNGCGRGRREEVARCNFECRRWCSVQEVRTLECRLKKRNLGRRLFHAADSGTARTQERQPKTRSRRPATPWGRRGTSSRSGRPSRHRPPCPGTWSRAPSRTGTDVSTRQLLIVLLLMIIYPE